MNNLAERKEVKQLHDFYAELVRHHLPDLRRPRRRKNPFRDAVWRVWMTRCAVCPAVLLSSLFSAVAAFIGNQAHVLSIFSDTWRLLPSSLPLNFSFSSLHHSRTHL